MNIIKTIRKPYFSLVFSAAILFTSCSQTDSFNSSIIKREITSFDIEKMQQLKIISITNEPNNENNFNSYMSWININNWHINYRGFNDQNSAKVIMSNSLQKNINFAKESGIFSSQEIIIIDNFISKITNSESTEIFLDVLNNFKSEIDGLNLSKENYAKYDNLFTSLIILNKVNPEVYNYNQSIQNTNRCVGSAIGLALSYAALFTIEVGSFGSATVLTCVGFVWASATFGSGCK
ncbi:MAG: hypothetical protein FGM16_07175 [Flavobacterium sp.]|jgi:hypothetical protein|nr:hypothetical protein [Flavobacterium sp.]